MRIVIWARLIVCDRFLGCDGFLNGRYYILPAPLTRELMNATNHGMEAIQLPHSCGKSCQAQKQDQRYFVCSVFWYFSFVHFFHPGSNILQAGNSYLGGPYYHRPRPVCVALLPEHHAEFVCGKNLAFLEEFSGKTETCNALWAMT